MAINYKVYQFVNRVTGLVYIGVTKRSIEERKAEHMLLGKENSQRKILRAVQQYPLTDQWDINTLYETPLHVEALMMEAAFTRVLHAVDNGYNANCAEVDPLCNAVAHSIATGQDILKHPFERVPHGDYPDVWMFKIYTADTWSFGYHSGNNWVMYQSECHTSDEIWHRVSSHFENYEMEPSIEPIHPQVDQTSPLQSLAEILEIIKCTDFTRQDDVEHFFIIINGMKTIS